MQNFFQPVEVYPTTAQIEIATRNVQYCNILNPINRSCPISLETFNDNDMVVVIRFCGHIFKPEQIATWFRSNCKCPVCRYDIRNYNSNSSNYHLANRDISGNFLFDSSNNCIPDTSNTSNRTLGNTDSSSNFVFDSSNNYTEENIYFTMNEDRRRTRRNSNTILNYLDVFIDSNINNRNYSNDNLLNEFINILDNGSDSNSLLTLFNNVLRRT